MIPQYLLYGMGVFFILLSVHCPYLSSFFNGIDALGLVGGLVFSSYFSRATHFFSLLIVRDLLLGGYPSLPFTYLGHLCFFITGNIFVHSSRSHFSRKIFLTLLPCFCFFLISNFGVWWCTAFYEKNIAGLSMCYLMGLPFFLRHLVATSCFAVGLSWCLQTTNSPYLSIKAYA